MAEEMHHNLIEEEPSTDTPDDFFAPRPHLPLTVSTDSSPNLYSRFSLRTSQIIRSGEVHGLTTLNGKIISSCVDLLLPTGSPWAGSSLKQQHPEASRIREITRIWTRFPSVQFEGGRLRNVDKGVTEVVQTTVLLDPECAQGHPPPDRTRPPAPPHTEGFSPVSGSIGAVMG